MIEEFKCPKCGGDLLAWADLDAMITFKVKKDGGLTKGQIKNTHQTDGRCGVNCTKCDWEISHLDEVGQKNTHLEQLANEALELQHQISLLSVRKWREK